MAGKIPQAFIDDLLNRIDIVDVINPRVTLKKSGSNYTACCPFHNEKTPSFSVSQTKQFYYCFGCGEKGNAIGFLMAYDNMHFVDAIETLAESIGLEVPRDEQATKQHSDNRPLYTLMDSVAQFYQTTLRDAPAAIDYLKQRGLSGETAKRYGIGYAPDGWDGLQKAFPDEDAPLLKTGMLTKNDNQRVYQRFRDRIMFPIRDRRGRVIGFGGRVMGNDEPKYLNSPETPLFHKGSELYGLFEARKAIQDAGMALVVEGYMDVVALAEHNVDNAVATLGTAANQQHSEILFKVVPNIVFCFDGDKAGRTAAWRALVNTLPCLQDGRDAHFLFLPDGEDPDSIVSKSGHAGFQDLLATRQSIIDFLYDHLSADIDMHSIGGKAMLADKAKPLLETIPRGVYKQLATRRLETLIGLPLGSERAGAPKQATHSNNQQNKNQNTNLTAMSRSVLLVLQHPSLVKNIDTNDLNIDTNIRGADVFIKLINYCIAEPDITTARLLERFRESPNHAYLSSLAVKPYLPDNSELDESIAQTEFMHSLAQLKERSKKTDASKVDASARTGLLSIPKNK
jgi:DNA primase